MPALLSSEEEGKENREGLQKVNINPASPQRADRRQDTPSMNSPDFSTQFDFAYESEGSQEENESSDGYGMCQGGRIDRKGRADASDSGMSSSPQPFDQEEAQSLDLSLENFNSILRPNKTMTENRRVRGGGHGPSPWSLVTSLQQAPVLSLQSPVLGRVDINKGSFAIIMMHDGRNRQLESELARLRRERDGLDTELLCRGEDIRHYKKEIASLKEAAAARNH